MVDAARGVAFEVLRAIDDQDAYVNLLLPRLLREHRLDPRDAAFATELAHGTVRRIGTYDAILDRTAKQGVAKLDPPVRDVLRLGIHQLLSMRVPSHAAVSTSVDLVRRVVGHRPASFVNAVLRKVSQADLEEWTRRVAPSRTQDAVGHLSVAHSHPRWVVEALRDALGDTTPGLDETALLLAADNDAPGVTLVARPGLSTVEELADDAGTPGRWSPWAVHLGGGDPGRLAAVREHRAGVQDEGSQLVALALAGTALEGDDVRWLDLCAGPGGKAALLAAVADGRGAHLVANELQEHRAELVRQSLQGVPSAVVVVGDGRQDVDGGPFDRVLVDAPCTGLGALRRRPEARWRRSPADVPALVTLQGALLESAWRQVRSGGVVAYATCSPHREETVGVVEAFLAGRDDVEVLDATAAVPMSDLDGPFVQLWPHRHGTDAMFLALLRRR
ncbi:MAG: transcription antitermination factor NusB [Polaromonas sp.]|nr:transcription antitermination factor NusB [Polaromonas sp.]